MCKWCNGFLLVKRIFFIFFDQNNEDWTLSISWFNKQQHDTTGRHCIVNKGPSSIIILWSAWRGADCGWWSSPRRLSPVLGPGRGRKEGRSQGRCLKSVGDSQSSTLVTTHQSSTILYLSTRDDYNLVLHVTMWHDTE